MPDWLRVQKFVTRLVLIGLSAMLPSVALTIVLLVGKQTSIYVATRELAGLQQCRYLEAMLLPLGVHEIWSAAAAAGEGAPEMLQPATADVVRAISQQDANGNNYGAPRSEDSRRWMEIKSAWAAVASAKSSSVIEVVRLHSELRHKILSYRDYVAAASGLLLVSDPAVHFMVDATVLQIVNYESYVTEARSQAASVGVASKATLDDVAEITRAEVLAQGALDNIEADLKHAAESRPSGEAMRPGAEKSLLQVKSAFDAFSEYVKRNVISGAISDPLDDVLQHALQLTASIRGFHDSMHRASVEQLQHTVDALKDARNHLLWLVALSLIVSSGLIFVVAWTTVVGINQVIAVVSCLAEGDYTRDIPLHDIDEIARIMQALRTMQLKLTDVLSGVKDSAMTVATGAAQVNAVTLDLSGRSDQQAANLGETSTSMRQMSSSVQRNAASAKLADDLARTARELAERGGTVIGKTVAAMAAIDAASRKIADVITVIDSIAFQTNLLALNAAVEAARAAEQGRGFAVVANEVRTLAQRSTLAAKQIKGLIHDSVGKLEEGNLLVGESGQHLGAIVTAVKKVSDVVGEISVASQDQAASAEQITRAVMQIDQNTQRDAAALEQASSAAGSMSDQATRLLEMTAFFKLKDGQGVRSLRDEADGLAAAPSAPEAVEIGSGTGGWS